MPRPRKPRELKEAQGTLRKHRENQLAPNFDKTTPVAPDNMSAAAKKYFARICQLMSDAGTLTVADVFCIAQLAELMEREDKLKAELKSYGSYSTTTVTKTGSDMPRLYPHISALSDIARVKATYLTKLGLTPADRSQIQTVHKDTEEDSAFLALFG